MTTKTPKARTKVSKEQARASLSGSQRQTFDLLVESVGNWSSYFYGTKFISYAILAELIRDGWKEPDAEESSIK